MENYSLFVMLLACTVWGRLNDPSTSVQPADLRVYSYSRGPLTIPKEVEKYLESSLDQQGYNFCNEGNFSQDPLEICNNSVPEDSDLTVFLVNRSDKSIHPCLHANRYIISYQPSEPSKLIQALIGLLGQKRKLVSNDCPNEMILDSSSGQCICSNSSYSLETLCECPISSDPYKYIVNCDFQGISSADCYMKESLCDTASDSFYCESGYSLKDSQCMVCIRDVQNCKECPAILGQNLVNNADFEELISASSSGDIPQWLTSSSFPGISNNCLSGQQCLEGQGSLYQVINDIDSAAEYTLSIWVFVSNPSDYVDISIGTYSITIRNSESLNDWAQFRITGITGLSNPDTLSLELSASGTFLDHVQLEKFEDLTCSECLETFELDGTECVCDESSGKEIVGGQCLYCERWISEEDIAAYFSSSYTSLMFDFSVPVDQSGIYCDSLFENSVLERLGSGYNCEFVNEKTFKVELGDKFLVRNEIISIKEGVLKGIVQECGHDKSGLDIEIQYIYTFPKPEAKLQAPSVVNYGCEDLYIDGRKSEGRLKQSLLYKWTFVSLPENLSLNSFSSDIYNADDALEIYSEFIADGTIIVTLSVMNFLGEISEKSHEITASELYNVSILFDRTISYEFKATSTAVYSIGAITYCKSTANYKISWSLLSQNTGIDQEQLWGAQTDQWTLVIPSHTFTPNSQVVFEISVEGFSNTEELELSVIPENPIIIADKTSGPVNINEDFTIDASKSYDPNENKPLSYLWTCISDDADCSDFIENPTFSVLLVKENQLEEGKSYEFTLKCSLNSVSSEKKFVMNGVNYGVPEANMHLYNSELLPDTLSAYERNRVQLTIDGAYTYNWYTKNKLHSFEGSTIHSSIVSKENTLDLGENYKLATIVSNSTHSYEFIYDFYVNLPPSSGYFTSTQEGIEYSSVFEMNADEWIDPEGLDSLFYSFGFTANGIDYFMSIKNQSSIYYALLPSSATHVWVDIHDSYDYTRETFEVNVAKDPNFDQNSFISSKEEEIKSDDVRYTDLPYILNNLNVQEHSDPQRVFDMVNHGVQILIDNIPEYTQNAAITVLNIIENSIRTPELMTDDNIKIITDNVKLLLNSSFKDIGVPIRVLKEYHSVLSSSIYPDYEYVYHSKFITTTIYSTISEILKLTSQNILEHEILEIDTPNIEVQEFLSDTASISNTRFFLPSGFEIEIPELTINSNAEYFITAAAIKPLKIGNESIPYIIDFIIYDRASLDIADINLQSNITIESPVYQIELSLTLDNAACVFLNPEKLKWEGTGCFLVNIGSSSITCACNHLTIFCAGAFVSEGDDSFAESNIEDPYDQDNLETADEFSLIGLYFCSVLLILFIIGFYFARKYDKNDRKVHTGVIDLGKHMPVVFTGNTNDPNHSDSNRNESQYENKSICRLFAEKNHMISPFRHFQADLPRTYRLCLCFIDCFGTLFFLSLFYQYETDNGKSDTVKDAITNYEYTDIWKIIYSVLLMIPITEVFSILLRRKNNKKSTRVKNVIGMVSSALFMLFCTWNITGFVIAFSKHKTYMWLFSAIFTLLFGLIILESAKIVLIKYILIGASKLSRRRKKAKASKKERLPIMLKDLFYQRYEEAFMDLNSFCYPKSQDNELDVLVIK